MAFRRGWRTLSDLVGGSDCRVGLGGPTFQGLMSTYLLRRDGTDMKVLVFGASEGGMEALVRYVRYVL